MPINDCPLCQTAEDCLQGKYSLLIHEFTYTYLVFGVHQFYPGYGVLILKEHCREMHHLEKEIQEEVFRELMQAGKAVDTVFQPWKMNYASYGNLVPHLHWHIIPRYENDLHHKECPFNSVNSSQFEMFPTQIERLHEAKDKLKKFLINLS